MRNSAKRAPLIALRDGTACMTGAAPDSRSVPHWRRIFIGAWRVVLGLRLRILIYPSGLRCEPLEGGRRTNLRNHRYEISVAFVFPTTVSPFPHTPQPP